MKKIVRRRRARRRSSYLVRLPLPVVWCLLAEGGFQRDASFPRSERSRVIREQLYRVVAMEASSLVRQSFASYAEGQPDWPVDRLLRYFSGVPHLRARLLLAWADKWCPSWF